MQMLRKKTFKNNGETQQAIALTYFNTCLINSKCITNIVLYNIHILSYLFQILYPVTKCIEIM